jgi:hypothetical protein
MRLLPVLACCLWLGLTPGLHAGLHQTLEPPFPRNPDCNAFFRQLMYLRDFGPSDPKLNKDDSPQRKQYFTIIAQLKQKQEQGPLSAEEIVNLSQCLIRVRGTANEPAKYLLEALDVLKPASLQHPKHFAIHANLGTAFHMLGSPDDLQRAKDYLEEAVHLAPPEWKAFEETHLRLVRVRLRAAQQPRDHNLGGRSMTEPEPDQIFHPDPRVRLRFVGPSGQWEVGKLAAEELAKLPGGSLALATEHVQQLLIWMPYDARLVWLLGELANAQGQIGAARIALDNASYNNPGLSGIRSRLRKLETWLQWQDVLSRSTVGAEGWLAQNIGGGLLLATPGDGAAVAPWCGNAKANLKMAGAEDFPDLTGGGNGPDQGNGGGPRELLQWTMKHWLLTAFGLLLILLLLAFQYREWRRRRSRKAATST